MTDTPASPAVTQSDDDQDLVGLIYETALDNSLWPEMIAAVYHEMEVLTDDPQSNPADLAALQTHFTKGV